MMAAAAVIADRNEFLRNREALQRRKKPQKQPALTVDYVEVVVPGYSDAVFKSHFRMQRTSFEELCRLLGPHLTAKTVSIRKKILSSLWLLGNTESFRGVANRFGLSKATLHSVLFEVCNAIETVWGRLIVWPTTSQQYRDLADGFRRKTGFPGVVGAIDATHIPIPGPKVNREAYINRKGFPSMQLQAVCDSDLRFLDIVSGWAGSVHDARVFRNSALSNWLANGNLPEDHHLLGDSAYALTPYLIVPYRDNGSLTPEQTAFNQRHTSARVVIEKAFNLLKCKFRRLKYLDMKVMDKIPQVICAACALHNFILLTEKLDNDEDYLRIIEQAPADVNDGSADEFLIPRTENTAGQAKRDELTNLLSQVC